MKNVLQPRGQLSLLHQIDCSIRTSEVDTQDDTDSDNYDTCDNYSYNYTSSSDLSFEALFYYICL